jgi:ribonuclease HI
VPNKQQVIIYTDGGCAPNPGIGGWGAVLLFGSKRKEISGGERESTNNRMELMAAIESLTALTRPCTVKMVTDSKYVKQGVQEWMPQWKLRGWKRKTGAIKNLELWKQLDLLAQDHEISWAWVKGHSGVPENERCDELAGAEIERIRQG